MDAEFETEWHPSAKLNVIGAALDFTRPDPLPDNVTRDEVEEYCYTLEQLYGEYVDEVAAETTLSRREATTWVLRNLVHEGADRLTFDAIGLYIWAIGRATEGDPLSRTIVADYADRAREKAETAEATVARTDAPPYPDDLFDDPAMLWVAGDVADRLTRRLREGESYSDALERLLDATLDGVALADLVDAYREERDATFVGVQTARPRWDLRLPVVVHLPADVLDTPPESVPAAESVVVDDHPYPYTVEERPAGTPTEATLALFAEGSGDAGAVTVAEGLDRLRTALDAVEATLPELVERARDAGAAALAVADTPAGAGAHLLVVGADDGGFESLDRLTLVDRTLRVTRVERLTAAEYADRTDATLLWASGDGDIDPTPLPDDPAERRDRIPAPVLRTG